QERFRENCPATRRSNYTRAPRPTLGQHIQLQERPLFLEMAEACSLSRNGFIGRAAPSLHRRSSSTRGGARAGKRSRGIPSRGQRPSPQQIYSHRKAPLVFVLHGGHDGHAIVIRQDSDREFAFCWL